MRGRKRRWTSSDNFLTKSYKNFLSYNTFPFYVCGWTRKKIVPKNWLLSEKGCECRSALTCNNLYYMRYLGYFIITGFTLPVYMGPFRLKYPSYNLFIFQPVFTFRVFCRWWYFIPGYLLYFFRYHEVRQLSATLYCYPDLGPRSSDEPLIPVRRNCFDDCRH